MRWIDLDKTIKKNQENGLRINQAEMARITGFSRTMVNKWCKGRSGMSKGTNKFLIIFLNSNNYEVIYKKKEDVESK